jgi:hypothetical protein
MLIKGADAQAVPPIPNNIKATSGRSVAARSVFFDIFSIIQLRLPIEP